MSLLSKTADTIYAFRFLKLLTTPFEKTEAFKLGVIDKKGKKLKKPETNEEKSAYTLFHRLVFNIKKIIPGKGLGSYAAALFLLRNHTEMSGDMIHEALAEVYGDDVLIDEIKESFFIKDNQLMPGNYILKDTLPLKETGDELALQGSKVSNPTVQDPIGSIFDINIYEVQHKDTKQKVLITQNNIER